MFEIGDVIKWKAGNVLCKGIFKREDKNTYEVICFEINNLPTKKKLNVSKYNKFELDEI